MDLPDFKAASVDDGGLNNLGSWENSPCQGGGASRGATVSNDARLKF